VKNFCAASKLFNITNIGLESDSAGGVLQIPVDHFDVDLPMKTIERLIELVDSEMNLTELQRDDLTHTLTELLQNVLDHAASPGGGIVTAGVFRQKGEVRFAVADIGVGLRATLSKEMSVPDDKVAIQKAIQENVSGRSTPRNMGFGLANLHSIVKRTGGRLVLASGQGYLDHMHGRDRFGLMKNSFVGTLAFVKLPIQSSEKTTESSVGKNDVWSVI